MNFKRTEIHDVVTIEPQIHDDERGYFTETFRNDKLEEFLRYTLSFCQYYSPQNDRMIAFDNKALNIDWQIIHSKLYLSAKEKFKSKLAETEDIFAYGVNYHND